MDPGCSMLPKRDKEDDSTDEVMNARQKKILCFIWDEAAVVEDPHRYEI